MVAILLASGPNDFEMPCRVFETLEDGKEFCDKLFDQAGSKTQGGGYLYTKYLDEGDDPNKTISEELFTKHYYGCGGPGPFYLTEIPFNERFVKWDLD